MREAEDLVSLVFANPPSEKRFEKGSEFDRLGRQLSPPVTNLIKLQGHLRLKPGHSHLEIA